MTGWMNTSYLYFQSWYIHQRLLNTEPGLTSKLLLQIGLLKSNFIWAQAPSAVNVKTAPQCQALNIHHSEQWTKYPIVGTKGKALFWPEGENKCNPDISFPSKFMFCCQLELYERDFQRWKNGLWVHFSFVYISATALSLSLSLLLEACIFSSPFICQFFPLQSFPLHIYSGMWNEILLHFWLLLNAFIQNRASENDFHWEDVRVACQLACRQSTVPYSCDMNALADGGGKQNEGGKRSYKLKTLILILEASSRRVWQWSSAPASTVCVTRTLSTSTLCSNF